MKFFSLAIIMLICSIFTGCYTCGQAMDIYYRNCLDEHNDKEYCRQRATLESQDMGYCSTTTIGFGFNYNY